jgi:hypothetical protein
MLPRLQQPLLAAFEVSWGILRVRQDRNDNTAETAQTQIRARSKKRRRFLGRRR